MAKRKKDKEKQQLTRNTKSGAPEGKAVPALI
jgi:hypothetical protein